MFLQSDPSRRWRNFLSRLRFWLGCHSRATASKVVWRLFAWSLFSAPGSTPPLNRFLSEIPTSRVSFNESWREVPNVVSFSRPWKWSMTRQQMKRKSPLPSESFRARRGTWAHEARNGQETWGIRLARVLYPLGIPHKLASLSGLNRSWLDSPFCLDRCQQRLFGLPRTKMDNSVAERGRFELPVVLPTHDFQSCSLDQLGHLS